MLESVDVLAIAAAAAAAIYDSVLVLGVTHVCCPNSCCETHVPAAVNCTYPCHQPRLLSTQQELKSTVLSANLKAHPTPLPPPPSHPTPDSPPCAEHTARSTRRRSLPPPPCPLPPPLVLVQNIPCSSSAIQTACGAGMRYILLWTSSPAPTMTGQAGRERIPRNTSLASSRLLSSLASWLPWRYCCAVTC